MMRTRRLLQSSSFLKQDTAASAKEIKLWSLRTLANLGGDDSAPCLSPETSEILLVDTVHRLDRQELAVDEMLEMVDGTTDTQGQTKPYLHSSVQRLRSLKYIHHDTRKVGEQLLANKTLWQRFSDPDRHVINATFLELRARHANTIETVVDLVTDSPNIMPEDQVKIFHGLAEVFLRGRLGTQLLCDHHAELYKGNVGGAVTIDVQLSDLLKDAVLEAQYMVDVHLQIFPETVYPSESDVTCTMIKPWVHHAVVELLKNAMASSVYKMKGLAKEPNNNAGETLVPPPIEILLETKIDNVYDKQKIVICIVDQGTSISGGDAGIAHAFMLGHSSQRQRWDRIKEQQSYAAVRSPLSSLGVGLPISRYMMEHFGGSLTLTNNNPKDHNGCTARIELPTDDTILEREPAQVDTDISY